MIDTFPDSRGEHDEVQRQPVEYRHVRMEYRFRKNADGDLVGNFEYDGVIRPCMLKDTQ